MRASLEKLQRMVGDAELTAAGLPEHRDDAANRRVAKAREEYLEAAEETSAVYAAVNQRLNTALYLNKRVDQVDGDIKETQDCLEALRKAKGERKPTDAEIKSAIRAELRLRQPFNAPPGSRRIPTLDPSASKQLQAATGSDRLDRARADVRSQQARLFARPPGRRCSSRRSIES